MFRSWKEFSRGTSANDIDVLIIDVVVMKSEKPN